MAAEMGAQGEGEGDLSAVSKPDSCANNRPRARFVV